ncbi:3'-5' exonuclease, partial [Candidatus Woesearchaeota archaeon]|nr:3'-5' exonuclease [Candidatus Woesearchaeota archaeon]
MRSEPAIVLDIETTGLSPYASNITEIAAVKVANGKQLDSFHTLVNPGEPIPKFITRLTGITDDMVQNAPRIQEVLPELKKFLGNHTIIAHNAGFDYKFISHNMYKHYGEELTNPKLCTAKLARRIHSTLPSKRLGALCEFHGVVHNNAHRAMGDTLATIEIYHKMLYELEKGN